VQIEYKVKFDNIIYRIIYKIMSGKDNKQNDSESEDTFLTVDDLTKSQNLIPCYQMQVNDNNVCSPAYLGMYPDVPLVVSKIINYNNHNLHVVTYVLTKEEIENKLYKIVGVNIFKENKRNSLYSLDLVMNEDENGQYQLLFNDHKKNTTTVVENLEKFPGKDKILDYIIKKTFEDPLKSILIK
jgi:hypothetical protein